jgi:hypothetical protein
MSWNYRVLVSEEHGEPYFSMHEVHYTNDIPHSYTKESISVSSETIEGINWHLEKMQEALSKPILYYGERFPQEYKENPK